jgi:hypothetical protein
MPALLPVALALAVAQSEPGASGQAPTGETAPPSSVPVPVPEVIGQPLGYEPMRSLLGGQTLGDGTVVFLGFAGFPAAGVAYAQGVSDADDLGILLQFDWAATELLAAGLWRLALWQPGGAHLALTLRAGFYACFGATYIYSPNVSDQGGQVAPGLALSFDAGRDLITVALELPGTVTFQRGGGFVFGPKATAAFEAPLHADLSAGVRAGAGGRWASGGAPGAGTSRTLLELTGLITWRAF